MHLRTWDHYMGEKDDISQVESRRFKALLDLFIFVHVNGGDTPSHSDICSNIERDLSSLMPHRLEYDERPYIMFNITVEEICPDISGI